MLRGGIVGFGKLAVYGHLPGWAARSDVDIVAAADVRTETREELAERLPGAHWYASVEAMLDAEELDLVDVCTPPVFHAGQIRSALERRLHVLCEKPLVVNPDDVTPLAALANHKRCALVTVHNWRYAPALAKVTELLRGGAVGQIRTCRWETQRTGPAAAAAGNWRTEPAQSGGGVLIDHGWHAFSTVNFWLGRPVSLSAGLSTRRHHAFPVEDTAVIAIDYGSAKAEIFLTWAADQRANRLEIRGSQGRIVVEGGRVCLAEERDAGQEKVWTFPSLSEGSQHPDWFAGVLDVFFAEVGDESVRGRNLEEATLCVELLSLAQESNRIGEAVPVPEGRR